MKSTAESNDLAHHILEVMCRKGLTLSTAESCTSGRIAAILTAVSGASDYFQGGVVVYQDELKIRFLGVDAQTIAEHDVVSREVVEQMVVGCCRMFGTDYAIASTGYTGGGNNGIPAGTVWIGWGCPDDVHTMCLTHDQGRELNTSMAALTAVSQFWNYLKDNNLVD